MKGEKYRSDREEWFVAHVKPRCEKKLLEYGEVYGFKSTLPTYKSVKKYSGKEVVFYKPLFSGYVFLFINDETRKIAMQSNFVANLLHVVDQELFEQQLNDILFALNQEITIRLEPIIEVGARVMIKSGPLQGQEGWVDERFGMTTVLLRLDFIGQAAAIEVSSDELELI